MLRKWSQFYYHDFNPAFVIPKCGPRGDIDLRDFLIWPFISWFANHHVSWRATVKNRCYHVPWELVWGFGTIIGSGRSSGIWKTHRKYVSWCNTREVNLCSLHHFTFKAKRWHLSMFHMPGMPESHSQWVYPIMEGPTVSVISRGQEHGGNGAITYPVTLQDLL